MAGTGAVVVRARTGTRVTITTGTRAMATKAMATVDSRAMVAMGLMATMTIHPDTMAMAAATITTRETQVTENPPDVVATRVATSHTDHIVQDLGDLTRVPVVRRTRGPDFPCGVGRITDSCSICTEQWRNRGRKQLSLFHFLFYIVFVSMYISSNGSVIFTVLFGTFFE
uniref:Uncharacterized protein n=1 Tax=Anguilla anguilla TaxID=7936 RepID=A0A0E9WGE4_ANGAN